MTGIEFSDHTGEIGGVAALQLPQLDHPNEAEVGEGQGHRLCHWSSLRRCNVGCQDSTRSPSWCGLWVPRMSSAGPEQGNASEFGLCPDRADTSCYEGSPMVPEEP